jgi:hypothetical protein
MIDPQMSIVLLVDDPIMDERIPGKRHHAADIDSIGAELVAQAAKRAFHDEIQHLLVVLPAQGCLGDIPGSALLERLKSPAGRLALVAVEASLYGISQDIHSIRSVSFHDIRVMVENKICN